MILHDLQIHKNQSQKDIYRRMDHALLRRELTTSKLLKKARQQTQNLRHVNSKKEMNTFQTMVIRQSHLHLNENRQAKQNNIFKKQNQRYCQQSSNDKKINPLKQNNLAQNFLSKELSRQNLPKIRVLATSCKNNFQQQFLHNKSQQKSKDQNNQNLLNISKNYALKIHKPVNNIFEPWKTKKKQTTETSLSKIKKMDSFNILQEQVNEDSSFEKTSQRKVSLNINCSTIEKQNTNESFISETDHVIFENICNISEFPQVNKYQQIKQRKKRVDLTRFSKKFPQNFFK